MASPTTTSNPLAGIAGELLKALLPMLVEELKNELPGLISGLFKKKTVPPAPVEPAPPVVVAPTAPPLPQVPIPQTPPAKTPTSCDVVLSSVEKPVRVGGGPGINYPDPMGMSRSNNAFNYGCVAICYGFLRDQNRDEYLHDDIVAADLEFRTEWRVYKSGVLVAFMKGEGDTNPTGEGQPKDYHKSESAGVIFGDSRWRNSAGFDNRITFEDEGDFEIELTIGGVTSKRLSLRTS